MSLIERALQKARSNRPANPTVVPGPDAVDTTASPRTVPLAQTAVPEAPRAVTPAAPVSRVAADPQLIITESFLREKGLQAPPPDEGQQRAEYRHIKRGLFEDLRDRKMKPLMLITSALQGEGKSFSATNLALSLAVEPDYTVLLVDADVIRPNLSRTFALIDRPGLMDAVADPAIDVHSLILTTNVEGLSILPAGRPHENATEHFASERMRSVIEQLLAVPNRIVVIDSLPLLLTTEARALSPIAGLIVMVVRAESTPQHAVMQGIELLGENANVKLLLNAVVRSKAMSYLGSEYGYGYNYTPEKTP